MVFKIMDSDPKRKERSEPYDFLAYCLGKVSIPQCREGKPRQNPVKFLS